MLIDLEDNKLILYYLKLKGKEYKLILEFSSPIINKKELYEKYNSTTSKKIINNKCFDTNCYIKKPIEKYKDRPDLFLITLPKFVCYEDMIIEHEDIENIFNKPLSIENFGNLKKSSYVFFGESNIIELLIKGNRIGPTNFIMFYPYIDYDIFKEKTGYENINEMLGKSTPSLKILSDLEKLHSIKVILKEKCYIDYRIEIA